MQKLEDADNELDINRKKITELQSNTDKIVTHNRDLEKQVLMKDERLKQLESTVQKVLGSNLS